jgi:hypothetical protein
VEAASKGASRKLEPEVKYNKCVVAFAIRVVKGKDSKVGFDKKIVAALSFLYQPSRSSCADILMSLTKGPLTV